MGDASSWSSELMSFQGLRKTSVLFALVKRVSDTREVNSIASFRNSCARVGISHGGTELVASLSTEKNFRTKTLSSNTLDREFFPWLTLVQIPTDRNFSFALSKLSGSMGNTLSSGAS